jgi:hypothetical protein
LEAAAHSYLLLDSIFVLTLRNLNGFFSSRFLGVWLTCYELLLLSTLWTGLFGVGAEISNAIGLARSR